MSAAKLTKFKFALEIKSGSRQGTTLDFESDRVTIGRSTENMVVVADDPKMSRRHATIEVMPDSVIASNVSDKNVLKVNDKPVRSTTISDGDKLTVGTTDFLFRYVQYGVAKAESAVPAAVSNPLTPLSGGASAVPVAGGNAIPSAVPGQLPSHPQNPVGQPAQRQHAQQQQWEPTQPKASKKNFYILVGVIALFFGWLLTSSPKKQDNDITLRNQEQIKTEIEQSANKIRELKEAHQSSGKFSKQWHKSQEAYVRGRRDYTHQRYHRAILAFQAALSINPEHVLARQYLRLSQRKYDETIQQTIIQGRNSRDKRNFRQCKAQFALVMTMIKDRQSPLYQEAKQYHDECSLFIKGRY